MTEKTFKAKIDDLGGVIKYPMQTVIFPRSFRINNKTEALNLLDVLTACLGYTVHIDKPLNALKTAIKKGLLDMEVQGSDPLHLFDINPAALPEMFNEFDRKMEAEGTT
ncbi:MAG: hypothetical protein LBU66_08515 [Treponema sp.]|jgi:hypothetical protein|nr:hypothetical protein [Treponema sp.]